MANHIFDLPDTLPIRTFRELYKLTQLDVALHLGVSRLTYINWEQNTDKMSLGKYRKLLKYFKKCHEQLDRKQIERG